MASSIAVRYAAGRAGGKIQSDAAQLAVVERLARLEERIVDCRLARESSSLGWLVSGREKKQARLKGICVHGVVGRGKTMLMDLLFDASPVQRKRRGHFHEFMLHKRLHGFRQQVKRGEHAGEDPIELAAVALAREAWLICFDEFHVTDIADAMILGRLLAQLFERGIIMGATSSAARRHGRGAFRLSRPLRAAARRRRPSAIAREYHTLP